VITIVNTSIEKVKNVLHESKKTHSDKLMLKIPFVSVHDYLYFLKMISSELNVCGKNGIIYAAAAVSDFYIPFDEMATHKIQSSREPLVLTLKPVPKMLAPLVDVWCPKAFVVSFKLETDENILEAKSTGSLEKYGHNLVIGNLLSTRKWEFVFVSTEDGTKWIRVPRGRRTKSISGIEGLVGQASGQIDEGSGEAHNFVGEPPLEIESLIIPEIAALHEKIIAKGHGN